MEGVPRISMLSFPLRRSADTPSFKQKLKPFIRSMYGEDPDSYSNEVNALESLRAGAVHVTKDLGGVATLKKYFAQLHFLKSRFPLHEGQPCALSFSWYDAFSESVHGWNDVDYEMACVLYNIGALHTELGATDNRLTAEGMKSACTHFQCAAWAFSHLRSHYLQFLSPDIGPETLSLMTAVSLAQAQECILEKSLIDSRKSSITAKVALQIVDYYDSALRSAEAILKDSSSHSSALVKALKKCKKTLDVKIAYYMCLSLLYRGMQAEDDAKWGSRVAYYKSSLEKLNDAIKSSKALEKTDPMNETLNFTLDVVGGKVTIAEKDNEFIYHDKVPEIGVIEKEDGLKGVSLVKGIPFKVDDPTVSGGDIFARLVPIEAHEAASLYSEEKAKLLRNYTSRIQEKNENLDHFCVALQLDTLDLEGGPKIIPQELVDCCAGLSVNKDAVKRLSELMSTLSSLYHDVDGNMAEVNRLFAQEEERGTGGGKQSNVLKELSREASKYSGCHKVAGETNEALGESLRRHVGNLQILMKPLDEVVREHIPGGRPALTADNEEVVGRMKKLVGKVKEMKDQRVNLEAQLRDSLLADDITKRLVVVAGGEEELENVFAEEMKKHEGLTTLLDKNLAAQENIIRALTEANAAYADERRAQEESSKRRAEVIEDLIASYEAYDDLLGKLNKGVDFYTKLDVNVGKLLNRLKATLKVGEEEREASAYKKGASFMNAPVGAMAPAGGFGPTDPGMSGMPPSHVNYPPSSGTGLKLKDYLAMKKAGGGVPTATKEVTDTQPVPQQTYFPQTAYNEAGNVAPYSAPQAGMQATTALERPDFRPPSAPQQGYYPQPQTNYNGTTNTSYSTPGNQMEKPVGVGSNAMKHQDFQPASAPQQQVYFSQHQPQPQSQPQQPPYNGTTSAPYATPSNGMQNSGLTGVGPNFQPVIPAQQGYFPPAAYNGTTNAAYTVPAYSSMPFHTTTSTFPSTYSNTGQACPAGVPASTPGTIPNSSNPYGNGGVGPNVPQGLPAPVSYATASSYTASGTGTTPSGTSEYGNHSFLAQYVKQQGYNSSQQSQSANQQWPLTSGYGQYQAPQTQQQPQQWAPQEVKQPVPQQYQPQQSNQYHQAQNVAPNQYHQQPVPAQYQCQPQQQQQVPPQQQQQMQQPQQQSQPQSHQIPQHHQTSMTAVPYGQGQMPQGSHQVASSSSAPNMSAQSQSAEKKPATNFDLLSSLDWNDVSVEPLAPMQTAAQPQQQESAEVVVIKSPPLTEATTPATPTVSTTTPISTHGAANSSEVTPTNMQANAQITKPRVSSSRQTKNVDVEQLLVDTRKLEGIIASYVSEEKWASLVSLQNGLCGSKRVSVGRMYAMKNRAPDIIPFDEDRVPLPLTSDDYINASFLRPLSIPLIATQAPILLPTCSTVPDFFSMLWTEGVETWVTLVPNHDLGKHVYWPQEKGSTLTFGTLAVTLLAANSRGTVTERTFSLKNGTTSRVVIQLQLTSWGGHGLPNNPQGLIDFTSEVREYFQLQRSTHHPLVVHCIHGVGKTGLFSVLISAINDVLDGRPLPDPVQLGGAASACRKGLLVDKEHLKYLHTVLLLFCRSELSQNGVNLSDPPPSFPERDIERRKSLPLNSNNSEIKSSVDPFSLLDPLWSLKK